jgi:uncharacterized protein involved in exopolysaccharide biosynthesis
MYEPEKNDLRRKFLFNVDYLKYIAILKEQKSFIIVFTLSAMLSSLLLTYCISEKYEATATVYYRPIASSILRQKNTASFGAPAPAPPFKIISQTLNDIVKNQIILRPVVESLEMDKAIEKTYGSWYESLFYETKDILKEYLSNLKMLIKYGRIIESDPVDTAIQNLGKYTNIKATKDSYVYKLSVKDKYAKRSAEAVDKTGETLVKWMKDQDKVPARQQLKQLTEQLQNEEEEILILRLKRESLLKKNNVVSVHDETFNGTKSLYEMEQEYAHLSSLAKEKEYIINELESKIEKNTQGFINSDDLKKMKSEKIFEEIELAGLLAKKDSLLSSIKQLKSNLMELPTIDKDLSNLDMNISSAMHEYEYLKDLYLEAFAESSTLQSETKILHKSVVPIKPVQPIKLYHVGLSGLLGLIISTALIYVFAYFNIRAFFRSEGLRIRSSQETINEEIVKNAE